MIMMMIISIDNIYISIVTVFQHTETRPHIHISYILAWKCRKSETMCRKLESVKVKVWKCEKGSSVARSETQCSAGALPPSGGHTQPFPFYRESNCCWMWGHFSASSISQILSSVFLQATHQSSPHSIESNCCWICEREKDTKPFSASSISQISYRF